MKTKGFRYTANANDAQTVNAWMDRIERAVDSISNGPTNSVAALEQGLSDANEAIEVIINSPPPSADAEFKNRTELEVLFKTAQASKYTELTYTGSDITAVDVWSDSGKATKLFSKVINYTLGNISSIVITDEISSLTLTKTFAYSDGNLVSITHTVGGG